MDDCFLRNGSNNQANSGGNQNKDEKANRSSNLNLICEINDRLN